MALFTVGKKGIKELEADKTKVIFIALEKKLKVKIIPGTTDPYWVDFSASNGAYVPKNAFERLALQSRSRLAKDVVEVDVESVKKLIDSAKESTKK